MRNPTHTHGSADAHSIHDPSSSNPFLLHRERLSPVLVALLRPLPLCVSMLRLERTPNEREREREPTETRTYTPLYGQM